MDDEEYVMVLLGWGRLELDDDSFAEEDALIIRTMNKLHMIATRMTIKAVGVFSVSSLTVLSLVGVVEIDFCSLPQ